MRFSRENMSCTTEIFSDSSERNLEIDLCRLCMKSHDYYNNIFTSNVECKITVKDALHDLVSLQVAEGDGLPTTVCPLCMKKLTEFVVFKKICLDSNAILRKMLPRNYCKSFEGAGADDEESEPCVETKDGIRDVIENNSQLACSAQMTEIYIPVPDCLLPRDDNLFHVKEENEGHLSEENYPMLQTSDPAGISTDVSDHLATDELSNPLTYKCPSVKEDQISDDEEGYGHEDGTDGASSTLMHQDISGRVKVLEGELRKERASSKLREEELQTAKDDELFYERVEAMISSKMEALRESLAEEIAGAVCARMSPLLSDRGSSSCGASSDSSLALDGAIPSAESSKVLIGDVWCSGGSYRLLKCNPGNLSLWHNTLLTGCYAEPHKMRVRKTANTEKFSRKFLVAAQDLYMEWLEGCKGEGGERKYSPSKVVELVADLPRKLAECATNMGPKRGIDARIKAALAEGRSPNEVLAMVSPKARAKFEERQVVRQAKRTADDLLGQAEAPSDKQARACEDQGSERGSFRDHSPVGSPVSPPPTSPVLPPPTSPVLPPPTSPVLPPPTGGMNF